MYIKPFLLASGLLFCIVSANLNAQARLMNKMMDKAEDKLIEQVFDDKNKNQGSQSSDAQSSTAKSQNTNTKGEGLSSTGPDVNESIEASLTAYKNKKYNEARQQTRQAMQGIELEMGRAVLKSLPTDVNGLAVSEADDRVTSTGMGFVGLMIERLYNKGDQDMKVTIANNSLWLSGVNIYLSGGYTTTDQSWKEVKVQGYRGVIEYDESSGYKLSVPFGQSSILVLECVNFSNEQQVMAAANKISINDIKKQLGEQ